MSRIDKLIAQYCPKGVEFKLLGEIGEFIRGNGLQKSDLAELGVGAIHYGQIHTYYGTSATATKSFVRESLAAKLRKANPGDLVIATTSEDDESLAKAVAWIGSDPVVVSGDAHIFRHRLEPRYVSYFFQAASFQEQKKRHITGTKVRRISGNSLAKIRIPIPPIEIQREIANVLDKFNELEAELGAELRVRRKQYKYYRDSLLTFDATAQVPARWANLGDIATVVRGASPRPIRSYITEAADGIPWIKIGDTVSGGKYITGTAGRITRVGAEKSRRVYPGDFVLSNSMSFGRPYILKIGGCIHDGWLALSNFSDSFVPDFLYHLLSSAPIQVEFARRAGSGTVQNLNADIVKSISVPIPSLSEQSRIATILDKFDSLTNDLFIGLPAEIESRRKQYNHYRERLLNFQEAA